jgi:hypothetical protein
MTNPLSEAEATKLFNSVSAALGDPNKLNEIMAAESVAPAAAVEAAPEPEVKVEETPASGESPTEEEGKNEEPKPVEGEPAPAQPAVEVDEVEALRQKLKLMEHRLKSDDGRVSAFQRQYEAAKAELAELKKNAKPPSAAVAPESPETDEDLELLKKADPALYRILVKREEALKKEVTSLRNQLNTELAPVKQTVERAETESEINRLRTMVPNIADVVQSEAFATYRDHVAPAAVKQLLTSRSADDVVQGLYVYSAWVQANDLGAKVESAPASTPAKSPSVPNPVAQERERKLATSVNVGSPSTIPVKKELTEQELFENAFSQTLKRNEIRR